MTVLAAFDFFFASVTCKMVKSFFVPKLVYLFVSRRKEDSGLWEGALRELGLKQELAVCDSCTASLTRSPVRIVHKQFPPE